MVKKRLNPAFLDDVSAAALDSIEGGDVALVRGRDDRALYRIVRAVVVAAHHGAELRRTFMTGHAEASGDFALDLGQELRHLKGSRREGKRNPYPAEATLKRWMKSLRALQLVEARKKGRETILTPGKRLEDLIREAQRRTVALQTSTNPEEKHAPPEVDVSLLPTTGPDFVGRARELRVLDGAWDHRSMNIAVLVGWGGVGKTALVNRWLASMAEARWSGARRVFAWSFHSQGAQDRPASGDLFLEKALERFGDAKPSEGTSWDKGVRLARLIRSERTLLVLDGLEPLQSPHGPEAGMVRHLGVRALIRELAAQNSGLCVITTRPPFAETNDFDGSTCVRIDLGALSPEDGATLLRRLGAQGPDKELRRTSAEFGGHALAIRLLGNYLAAAHEGDLRARHDVGPLVDEPAHGGHAVRVLRRYESWLEGSIELDLIRLMGFFNGPAEEASLKALHAEPVMPGLTERLCGIPRNTLNAAVQSLRALGLITSMPDPAIRLDTHPLIREFFGGRISKSNPSSWREGHNRLFSYMAACATEEQPSTVENLVPLYAAVFHGCQARNYAGAFAILRERIQRGDKFYSTKNLGAYAADLEAISWFFDERYTRVSSAVDVPSRGLLLNMAGARLRALGRIQESIDATEAAADVYAGLEDWFEASLNKGNLAEAHLVRGEIPKALRLATESVVLALRSGDAFKCLTSHVQLADAQRQAGLNAEAAKSFYQAEEFQRAREPHRPFLYSVAGFKFHEFLLDEGRFDEVRSRCQEVIRWESGRLIDEGLDRLSAIRADLAESRVSGGDLTEDLRDSLNEALEKLRRAGHQEFVVIGLMSQAEFALQDGRLRDAGLALQEAMGLTERAGLRLLKMDVLMIQLRLSIRRKEYKRAAALLADLDRGGKSMGYVRLVRELEPLRGRIEAAAGARNRKKR